MDELNEKCCFCGKEIAGLGNNPAPVKEDGSCCDDCNENIVIPARLKTLDKAQIEADGLFRSVVFAVQRMGMKELREVWDFISGENA